MFSELSLHQVFLSAATVSDLGHRLPYGLLKLEFNRACSRLNVRC